MIAPEQPKVIFIDWYKTLSTSLFWIDHPNALLSSKQLAAISHVLFQDPELLSLWMKGFVTAERVVADIAAALRLDAPNILKELEYSCSAMKLYDPHVPHIIKRLRQQGMQVILATDNMDTFERWTVPALGLTSTFDGIITSVSRGALKSELQAGYSSFFGHYLSQHAIAPTDAILLDDTPIDAVVRNIGLNFRQVTHPDQLASMLRVFLAPAT